MTNAKLWFECLNSTSIRPLLTKATPKKSKPLGDKEIASRVSEIESGKAALVPYEQVEAEMDPFVAGLKEKE